MMDDILGLSTSPPANHTKRIKGLVRDHWDIPDDAVIMVSELRCHEDGCPDIETVIVIMYGSDGSEKIKISTPMEEVDAGVIISANPR